uniref:Uncharacterized protein n=1 Tax=Anguilla anguilla TaxID=7936 RepID=A0A0E9XK93_ANGAN
MNCTSISFPQVSSLLSIFGSAVLLLHHVPMSISLDCANSFIRSDFLLINVILIFFLRILY